MPALVICSAPGADAPGYQPWDVVEVLEAGQDPGASVRANARGQFAFCYVSNANAAELLSLLEPELDDAVDIDGEEKRDEIVKRKRKLRCDLIASDQGGKNPFTYREYRDARALQITQSQTATYQREKSRVEAVEQRVQILATQVQRAQAARAAALLAGDAQRYAEADGRHLRATSLHAKWDLRRVAEGR